MTGLEYAYVGRKVQQFPKYDSYLISSTIFLFSVLNRDDGTKKCILLRNGILENKLVLFSQKH